MTASNIQKVAVRAKALAEAGFAVFPVRADKTPYSANGLKDSSKDPWYVQEWFERHSDALIGIHAGPSNVVVLDIDYKEDEEGNVLTDGFTSLEREWLEVPQSFGYESVSGLGRHIMYRAPEGKNLPPKTQYRGMKGIDRRSGESYVVFTAEELPTGIAPAPEWLCDEGSVKTAAQFEGTVKEWYDSLEPGAPSLIVRSAMERARKQFEELGNDFSHAQVVERTYEAVRLGAERHPGVPELLSCIEDLFYSRTGEHSRGEDEWEHEFQEALSTGIENYGAVIDLYSSLPPYDVTTAPKSVPDRLLAGDPGDKDVFRDLLRELQRATDDDLYVTSALWNSPRTKDLAREWGLEFVHQRVLTARETPEPMRENPTIPDASVATPESNAEKKSQITSQPGSFVTAEELELVKNTETFVNRYLAGSNQKGFSVPAYDIPAAWTALSMSVGARAVTAYNGVGVNLWFIQMGNSGSGKSSSMKFLRGVLDQTLRDGDGYYNVGASSSPAAIHEELLMRDGKASMIFHDEAASFFSDLRNTEWMKTLEHHFSSFYDGDVEPSNKVRLPQELRGKYARTSFNLDMAATPDKLLSLVNTEMFESGFLSRVNWMIAPDRADNEDRYQIRPSDIDARTRTHPAVYDLAADLRSVGVSVPAATVVNASDEAWDRLSQAFKDLNLDAQKNERYDVLTGPLARLSETMVKCASLLALYRGDVNFDLTDATIAVYYASIWYENMLQVVAQTSESEFSRDVEEIEMYIKSQGGTVTETRILHRFRTMIQRSPRELEDRIGFLRSSGRILRISGEGGTIKYALNGG